MISGDLVMIWKSVEHGLEVSWKQFQQKRKHILLILEFQQQWWSREKLVPSWTPHPPAFGDNRNGYSTAKRLVQSDGVKLRSQDEKDSSGCASEVIVFS